MKRKKNFSTIALGFCFCITACSKASEDKLQQQHPTGCDTLSVQYQTDVLRIISGNCYSCHGGGLVEGGVNLDGYINLKTQVDNKALEGAINHASGYTPMPLDQPKLSDCDINIISAWINAGAPNN